MINPTSKYIIGSRFGLIAGIIYVALLFCRFKFFSYNPQAYFYFSMVSFTVILICFLLAAIKRKKQLNGHAELKEIFQSVFISILITEAMYVLFIFFYLRYADPAFFNRFHDVCLSYYRTLGLTSEQIDSRIKGIDSLSEQAKPSGLVKGFGPAVIIDSIFGFIFAFFLRSGKTGSENPKI